METARGTGSAVALRRHLPSTCAELRLISTARYKKIYKRHLPTHTGNFQRLYLNSYKMQNGCNYVTICIRELETALMRIVTLHLILQPHITEFLDLRAYSPQIIQVYFISLSAKFSFSIGRNLHRNTWFSQTRIKHLYGA